MTEHQETIAVIAGVLTLLLVAFIAGLCRYAPMGDQTDDNGFWYTHEGVDHD